MKTRERTRIDFHGTHVETMTDYMANYCGCRPVRFTAVSRDDAIRQALDFFKCCRSALSLWPE